MSLARYIGRPARHRPVRTGLVVSAVFIAAALSTVAFGITGRLDATSQTTTPTVTGSEGAGSNQWWIADTVQVALPTSVRTLSLQIHIGVAPGVTYAGGSSTVPHLGQKVTGGWKTAPGYALTETTGPTALVCTFTVSSPLPSGSYLFSCDINTNGHPHSLSTDFSVLKTTSPTSNITKAMKPGASTAGASSTTAAPSGSSRNEPPPDSPSGCVFGSATGATPAFCDTFTEGPGVDLNRAGQLNDVLWGASITTGNEAFPSPASGWASAPLSSCGNSGLVNPPYEIQVCNDQLVDTVNDAGTVTSLAMYPKQPFDFSGRSGTIVFDVSNDTQGSHAAWPELWLTDQPVPAPFAHEATLQALPRNGFGIRFASCTDSSGQQNTCTQGAGAVGVDSAITIRDYAENDSFNGGSLKVIGLGSVLKSQPGSGQMNHYEIRVSQNQIDIYGTNAFTPPLNLSTTPLVHIATIPNANLNFTRGLVWLEDAHYNGNKFNTQRLHTFHWSNVGFDGPILPRDLGFDVPDNKTTDGNVGNIGLPGVDTGWNIAPNSSLRLTDPGVTGIGNASGGLLTLSFYEQNAPLTLTVAVNGHTISVPWPYPDDLTFTTRTLAVPVPLADIQSGNNTITFTTGSYSLDVMNIDLVLQGAGGVVAP